jgi:hypothetical protein
VPKRAGKAADYLPILVVGGASKAKNLLLPTGTSAAKSATQAAAEQVYVGSVLLFREEAVCLPHRGISSAG